MMMIGRFFDHSSLPNVAVQKDCLLVVIWYAHSVIYR